MPVDHAPAGPGGGEFVSGGSQPSPNLLRSGDETQAAARAQDRAQNLAARAAAHAAAHPPKAPKAPHTPKAHTPHTPKTGTPSFAELHQWEKDAQSGKHLTAHQKAALHAAHMAHLAHMAHEEKLAADAKAAAGAKAAPAARARTTAAAGAAPPPVLHSGQQHDLAQKAAWDSTPDSSAGLAEPQRFVLGIAYRAGIDPAIVKGQDGGRDYFTAESLEKAAHSYLRNGPRVGLFHMDGTDGDATATVVESYIYRNDQPWDLGDGLVVRKGDWVVGAILSPEAWSLYKSGRITGWSMQGVAKRRRPVREAF